MATLTLADAHALIQRHNNVRSIALLENEEIQRLAKKPSNIRNDFLLAPGREQTLQESIHFRSVAVHHSLAKDCQTTIPWHFHGKTLHHQLADWQLSRITQKTDGSDFLVNLLQTDMIETQSNNKKDPLPADGALVVVNCRSAVTSQVEVKLKQFLTANIRPVLFIDGLTEAIYNDQLPKEELYQSLQSTIDNMNQLIRRLESKKEIGFFLAPQDADVAFGSVTGWAFTIDTFARRFAKKFASDPSTMSRRLWGENYYNRETRKWSSRPPDNSLDPNDSRSFNSFILDTIYPIASAIRSNQKQKLKDMLEKLDLTLGSGDLEKDGIDLFQSILTSYLPAAPSVLDMMISRLPSPETARSYRRIP